MNALTGGKHQAASAPFDLFRQWMDAAEKSELNDPNAMCLATVDANGLPNARMVLLRSFDDAGFVFYHQQAKAPRADELKRAKPGGGRVALEESAPPVPLSRPGRKKSARPNGRLFRPVVTRDSRSASGRASNRARLKAVSRWKRRWRFKPPRFNFGDVPRPPYWGGYRIRPVDRILDRQTFSAARKIALYAVRGRRATGIAGAFILERFTPPLSGPAGARRTLAVFRKGEVLLATRTQPPYARLFTLPGGLVETGETLEAAALRELREETGCWRKSRLQPIGAAYRPRQVRAGRAALCHSFLRRGVDRRRGADRGRRAGEILWRAPETLEGLSLTPGLPHIIAAAKQIVEGAR